MPEKNPKQLDPRRDDGHELETQIILRIPEEPAKVLREAIETGANNLKDRLTVKLDNDLRYGEVRLDHWLLHAKVIDLPTVIESLKTIDNKSFYKTADICQLMICKEEPDHPSADEESPNKNKKKDPIKVDKKYLHPHGITPPCKNVRKRRFRKTLKKKYVEAPEIEKEVKRLLRVDNECVNVKWEVITEDDESIKNLPKETTTPKTKAEKAKDKKSKEFTTPTSSKSHRDVAEHDIFGGEVSSSDEDEANINVLDIDENSHISAEDSRLSDSNSNFQSNSFEYKSLFHTPSRSRKSSGNNSENHDNSHNNGRNNSNNSLNNSGAKGYFGDETRHDSNDEESNQLSKENKFARIEELKQELSDLKSQRIQKEQEISSIQNQTLRQRLQDTLDNLLSQILDKEMEVNSVTLYTKTTIQDLQSM